jgi:hypothetical protein
MGLQIRTYVDGQQKYLDLYGDENVTIDVSFAEIQDITKRNSAFTQEFKVPGSNNNNQIFNYFFDINSVALDWNPKRKFEAALIYDGYEIFNGNIRLNMVTIDVREKIYSVTFYSEVGDLAANIGDKALCNVDTSSLNHSLYDEDVAGNLWIDPSLHPTSILTPTDPYINPVTDGDVQYIIGQRGYDYTGNTFGTIRDINVNQTPLLDFSGTPGFFDNQYTPLSSPYLIPSIRTRKLYELIVNQADYQIESKFFDSDYFGRYYIPLSFNSESPYMAQSLTYDYLCRNLSGETLPGGGANWIINNGVNPPFTEFIFKAKDIIRDTIAINPIDPADYPSRPDIGVLQDYLFALPTSPNTQIQLKIDVEFNFTLPPNPTGSTSQLIGSVTLYNYRNNTTTDIIPISPLVPYPRVNMFVNRRIGPQTGTATATINIDNPQDFSNGTSLQFTGVDWILPGSFITKITISTVNKVVVLPLTIELYKEMSCDQKQISFIQNVNKMFNLVVVPHPIKPKTLIIEPIIDWIGKGRQLDWTDKVDYNSPQTLRPTTSIINGSIFAANKIDKDFVNTQYNSKTNKIFGEKLIDLGVDYKNTTINLTQTLGQNTDYYLNASGNTNVAIPCYFITKENNNNGKSVFEYRPFRSLPRMVFKSIPLTSGNTGQGPVFYRYSRSNIPFTPLGLTAMGDLQNVNRLTTYPFAISGFSHYTTYDASAVFTPDELVYPELENQYDRYYKDYIDDLISEENKIYNCKMYLKPWEVSQLYSNEIIFIKNTKFRINKITNLSLIEPSMCDVELVKLTKDYTPTPTLYYDLVNCENNCDIIHSNTDLNYLLWAFEGKYVTIGLPGSEKRYKVLKTQYNELYQYENVWFGINQTIGGVAPNDYPIYWNYKTFTGCSDTNQSYTLDPKNEFECVDVLVENTNETISTFTYTNCDGEIVSYDLNPNSSINVCGFYGSFKGGGFNFCPQIIGEPICPRCPCIGYSVMNNAFTGNATVTWIDCNRNPQSTILPAGLGLSFCACEGTVNTFDPFVEITDAGPCV